MRIKYLLPLILLLVSCAPTKSELNKNSTNYVECEAISEAMGAMLSRISSGYKIEESEKNMERMMKDAKKNDCYWFE